MREGLDLSSGFFFVNKPGGITSSDLVLKIKRRLNLKSMGHTGTLDRFAEGLLILPFGHYTAFSQIFLGKDKTYLAQVEVGHRTDSGDPDGGVEPGDESLALSRFRSEFTKTRLDAELSQILGWKSQNAPKISALKVGGFRQSDLVRSGVEVAEKKRSIQIHSVEIVDRNEIGFSFRVHVSSGTYIRKIVQDLSLLWDLPMHLSSLKRETIGDYRLEWAKDGDQVELSDKKDWREVFPLPARTLDNMEKKAVIHGGYLWDRLPDGAEHGFYLLDGDSDQILAWCTYESKPSHLPYRYRKVFFDHTRENYVF
ncbi:tRNA pseudouridine(55) synthase TruB [Leptospira sp. 96542]|nr:tRNA pseudouridine(55) synthase TruB [Leptospira sp. 96542]